jgi:hypothetical protein
MKSADTHEIGCIEPEMPGDFTQISILGRKDAAIGEGNVKKPTEQVFQNRSVVREQPPDLAGIALEPGSAFPREVEHETDVLLLPGRDLKYFAKSGDLVASDDAIGSGHFGAESDHRDGERDAATRIILWTVAVDRRVPARDVPRGAAEQRAQRATKGQLSSAVHDAADKTHGLRIMQQFVGIGAFMLASYGTIYG